jgi:ferredoxin--NADP+ reductase
MNCLGSSERPLRVAIIGSGPAGFYAVSALFSAQISVTVDLFERLPTPFGLVRAGVAPDHPKTKSILRVFDKLANREGFSFWGNVHVGRDVSLDELRAHYDAIIFATGVEIPLELGIPGEGLMGCHAADEFVGWYNGHPDYYDASFDFSSESAVVIGQGNVAADVVRMLLRPVDELRSTDISSRALDVLAESRVREVYLIGRRGPVQAKFTQQELEELGELTDCGVSLEPGALDLEPLSRAELEEPKNFNAKRNMTVFKSFANMEPSLKSKRLNIRFLRTPCEILGVERVESIKLEKNRLEGQPHNLKARGEGSFENIPCGLVFSAIGHKGVSIPKVPFDEKRHVIPNEAGRVLVDGVVAPGFYVVGWIKRGPSGLIGTNKADGIETVDNLIADLPSLRPCPSPDSAPLKQLLSERGVRVIGYDDWRRIDEVETAEGEARGKLREKRATIEGLLAAAFE